MGKPESLPEIDEEQARVNDRNLALGAAFLRDVLHRPEIVDEIPSGSRLAHRAVGLPSFDSTVRLTAFRPRQSHRWGVRVTGRGEPGESVIDGQTARWLYSIAPLVEHATWASANEACGAVERALQNASEAHLLAG
jgi:hypothetical protein